MVENGFITKITAQYMVNLITKPNIVVNDGLKMVLVSGRLDV